MVYRAEKMKDRNKKINKLRAILKGMKSVVVAYSGGVDSTFLLKIAKETLGRNNVLAVTAKSELFPDGELKDAKKYANHLGIKHIVIKTHELKNKKFVKNPINRCYYCKKELFSMLKRVAKDKKVHCVVDGTNFDDLKDFRFGRKAALELGIKSPLLEAGFKKENIRNVSKRMRLPTWNKSTFACLASRFPYNEKINKKDLKRVEELEEFLKSLGFRQIRARIYSNLLRIEVGEEEIKYIVRRKIREKIIDKSDELGFIYITFDLKGYRSGSMNEVLAKA